jgi:hypothetical protein
MNSCPSWFGARVRQQLTARDSSRFPRLARRPLVVDSLGGTQGLHRPGWRLETGGSQRHQLLRDRTYDDREAAYADYHDELTSAWKNRRPTGARSLDDRSGDDKIDDRCAAIRQALLQRGHDRENIQNYLSDLDDNDVLDAGVGNHVEAFEWQYGGRRADAAIAHDHRARMATLYAARDRELQDEWRRK